MKLQAYLNHLNLLSEKEIESALSLFYQEVYQKGDYYLQEGQHSHKISFIESGLFRLFYQVDGEEKIMLFFSDNQFMTDYFGYLTRSPSIRPIQALEESIVYSINREHMDQLFHDSKNWERVGRSLAESAYVASVLRANRIIHDSFDTRVEAFLTEKPDLLQRVPNYMIASYLNMTPETFSRVKRRLIAEPHIRKSIHDSHQSDFLI